MQSDTQFFLVWAHRGPDSIFGAASHPVVRNGVFLCFDTEERARAETDRLNARSGGTHMHYSVKPTPVQMALPRGVDKGGDGRAAICHAALKRALHSLVPRPLVPFFKLVLKNASLGQNSDRRDPASPASQWWHASSSGQRRHFVVASSKARPPSTRDAAATSTPRACIIWPISSCR